MEPTTEVKKAIVEANIQRVVNTIYDTILNARVSKHIEDKQAEENAKKNLLNLEKAKDFLEAELKALDSAAVVQELK